MNPRCTQELFTTYCEPERLSVMDQPWFPPAAMAFICLAFIGILSFVMLRYTTPEMDN